MLEKNEKLSVAAVAATLETTTMSVMMHIKRGLIKGEEIDGCWYVAADSLAAYQGQADGAARGELCKSSCKHGCSSC